MEFFKYTLYAPDEIGNRQSVYSGRGAEVEEEQQLATFVEDVEPNQDTITFKIPRSPKLKTLLRTITEFDYDGLKYKKTGHRKDDAGYNYLITGEEVHS